MRGRLVSRLRHTYDPSEGVRLNHYELITAEQYENLPEDQEQCFIEIETICRANMTRIIDNEQSGNDVNKTVMTTYMSVIRSAAHECGVEPLDYEPANDVWEEFGPFSRVVQGLVAKIRIRHRGARNPHSVQLTNRARAAIEIQVGKLRGAIQEAPLDEDRKRVLDKKLDELLSELRAGARISFGRVMATLALATATMAGVTTMAADGPQAIQNIMRLIGIEKLTEEEAVRRLTSPPRMLEPPKPAKNAEPVHAAARGGYSADLDDDIPF